MRLASTVSNVLQTYFDADIDISQSGVCSEC